MIRHSKRLSGRHIALLVAAVAYTGVAVVAEAEETPTPTTEEAGKPAQPGFRPGDQTIKPSIGPAPTSNAHERTSEPILDRPAPVTASPSKREPTRPTMDKPLIDTYLRTWPGHAAKAARATIAAYGLPNEATPSMLVWIENGPWHRTVVWKEEIVHDFPRSHYDVIENVVRLKVPLGKVNDVLSFEGSAVIKRTEGLLALRSNSEAMNFLAANLVNEIVTGKRNVKDARKLYARGVFGIAKAEPPVAATKLEFNPQDDRAQDPDQPMLRNEYADPNEKETPAAPPPTPMPSPNDLRSRQPVAPAAAPRGNDLNKATPPGPAPATAKPPKAVPGPKNGPGAGSKR